jgi:predicted nucleic acid-binding protein
VFVDTGYLIALEDADDGNHPAAMRHREGLPSMPPLTTTSYVVDEVVTFFNVRGQHAKAVELGEALLSSPSVRMIHVGEDLLARGLELLRERPDKRYSLTDCVSFVVMRERGIATAFAFDRHFEQEGFAREPRSG